MQTQALGLQRHINPAYGTLPVASPEAPHIARGLDSLGGLVRTIDKGAAVLHVLDLRTTEDLVEAREVIRLLATAAGFTQVATTAILAAASELSRNVLVHAGGGTLAISLTTPSGHLVLGAFDAGPGIPRLDLALTDGFSTTGSLGMGLPGSRRVMDRFEIRSTVGQGTEVLAAKLRPAAEE